MVVNRVEGRKGDLLERCYYHCPAAPHPQVSLSPSPSPGTGVSQPQDRPHPPKGTVDKLNELDKTIALGHLYST